MKALLADGRIKFGLTDQSSPKRKLFLNERNEKGDYKTPSSILLDAGTTKTGTTEVMELFDQEKVFDYPKPTTLICRLMKYGFIRDNDILLDFFSGSATSAHASLLYSLQDKISVRFIMVQTNEDLDEDLKLADTDSKKTIKVAISMLDRIGRPHLLSEIGKERIRRAGAKIKAEHPEAASLDTGFRVLKLDSSNMLDVYYAPSELQQGELFAHVQNCKPDRTSEDMLFQVMLELGATLDSKIERITLAGKTVYNVAEGYLVACFDDGITDEVVTAMAKLQPAFAALCTSSIEKDSTLINFKQIFDTYSPNTQPRTY